MCLFWQDPWIEYEFYILESSKEIVSPVFVDIVSRTGVIRRCLNEYHNEISIDDLLKKMMVESDNDENNIFTNVERQEFIYHIFRSVVVGGSLAQADENIFSYISATKSIYKGLLAVIKKPSNPNGLEITSRVYQVRCPAMSHSSLFLTKSSYNSCYVIVDPKKRLITAWHYSYQSFWWMNTARKHLLNELWERKLFSFR